MNNMIEYACNYALIRFLPYRDAGEFVNIGVALACGELAFLDFRVETQRYARVTHFFPELQTQTYRDGVRALRAECDRWRDSTCRFSQRHPEKPADILRHIFGELTRARESVFHFDTPRGLLTPNPTATLEQLFDRYVRRNSMTEPLHGEEALRARIATSLREFGVEKLYRPARVGTEDYHVQFPFVSQAPVTQEELALQMFVHPRRAIKPLNLNRDESSEIRQHGDDWYMRIKRLRETGHLPTNLLFPVQQPPDGERRIAAAKEIRRELESLGALTIDFDDRNQLLDFIRTET